MQPFTACTFHEALKPSPRELLSDFKRSLCHTRKRQAGIRIEVKDHPVRRMNALDGGAPWVYLNDAHLNHFHDALDVVHIKIFVTTAFIFPKNG